MTIINKLTGREEPAITVGKEIMLHSTIVALISDLRRQEDEMHAGWSYCADLRLADVITYDVMCAIEDHYHAQRAPIRDTIAACERAIAIMRHPYNPPFLGIAAPGPLTETEQQLILRAERDYFNRG